MAITISDPSIRDPWNLLPAKGRPDCGDEGWSDI